MSMPSIIVATCAPILDLMCVCAHLPKAADAPVLFIIATSEPRRTRKNSMPMLYPSAIEPMKPSFTTCVIVPSRENPE